MNSRAKPESHAEQEEREYLDRVQQRLQQSIDQADDRLSQYARDIQEQKDYLWNNRDEMDHVEKIAARDSIQVAVSTGDNLLARQEQYRKLQQSPYFGRFDFTRDGEQETTPVYIGVKHFYDEFDRVNRVFDWRAPVATLFYDYETGPVQYEAPEGEVTGQVDLKRQFRIKNGDLQLMIESSVNVMDEVLQDELGRASDDGMKNIVATIQRDQNAIIRNDQSSVLIIQGVAGSGKTSIALHRIAYLLYRHKDTLSSKDILIISPNQVFASYIANVLPELGEESVNEMGMDALANELLEGQYRFQTFFEQTSELLDKNDEQLKERVRFKSSPEFLKELGRYIAHVEKNAFQATDVWISRRLVPAFLLEEIYRKHRSLNSTQRINQVVKEVEVKVRMQYSYDFRLEDRQALKAELKGMIRKSSLRETYKQFYTWLGKPELFRQAKGGRLEYADVFPLIYMKMNLETVPLSYRKVKHLLIDEMQDYSAVQYSVIARLFPCKKTILGDAAQSVNPYSSSTGEAIQHIFVQAKLVSLNTAYRSSYEISQFSQRILPNPELKAIERHDEEPKVAAFKTKPQELAYIAEQAKELESSDHKSLGIICKTQKQAEKLYAKLQYSVETAVLLNHQSQGFNPGVIVCTAYMAKGLEFDRVIVPEATDKLYHTEMDRHLLYVACTRAMHRLALTHSGEVTALLK
ncbi:UvrD-helicase domain-containing protein [Saccharospirillum sp.]|uniref:HelD family protein n=1 Tax=Saccharospirillum sp. TaxID=2033801 RepID=UPI0034A09EEB